MKNTIKQLNELRDAFVASEDYINSCKIGDIIRTLINEKHDLQVMMINKSHKEKIQLINNRI